ncbi:hypothetical protein [Polyangium sorediatum]|uniref:Tryptophan synthase alpha chain n=1 Tax=Polyangium sorediatum TaxID=889274 RepID=A0ABT6P2L6_9BACT|nr:hypothetical protein [Polyangium sorediatum]MDI1434808.1 hypothetical protein [Polyangium sorediatum]
MRTFLAFALITAVFAACGSTVEDPNPSGSGGSAASSTSATGTGGGGGGTVCVPGETTSCTCHAVSPPGIAWCLDDGSGFGPCKAELGGAECTCPAGRSDGCCPGDGICCPCVQGCDLAPEAPPTDAFITCICAAGVCADACKVECAGEGITGDCAPCAQQAAMGACKAEYEACGGT